MDGYWSGQLIQKESCIIFIFLSLVVKIVVIIT